MVMVLGNEYGRRGPHPEALPLEEHRQGCDCYKCRNDRHRLQLERAIEHMRVAAEHGDAIGPLDFRAMALAIRDDIKCHDT